MDKTIEKEPTMSIADKVLALVGLHGLIVFNAILLIFVAEPDLIIVVSIGLIIGTYDIWRDVLRGAHQVILAFVVIDAVILTALYYYFL